MVDVANFLNTCGANIMGAGTGTIRIKGVDKLKGCTCAIIPDMIEAGTYMIAAAATKGAAACQKRLSPSISNLSRPNSRRWA